MNPYRFFALCTSFFVSSGALFAWVHLERTRVTQKGEELGLIWSRQWVQQLQNLESIGETLGKDQPVEWAIRQLRRKSLSSQQQIFLTKLTPGRMTSEEAYRFDFFSGQFDYSFRLHQSDDQVFRSIVIFPYQGFMGAPNPFWNYAYMAFAFVLMLSFTYLFTLRVPRYPKPNDKLKKSMGEWAHQH